MHDWLSHRCRYERACRLHGVPCLSPNRSHSSTPDFTVLSVKYVMTLIVGISSGFWVWSSKTISSWRTFYYRLFGGNPPVTAGTGAGHAAPRGSAMAATAGQRPLVSSTGTPVKMTSASSSGPFHSKPAAV